MGRLPKVYRIFKLWHSIKNTDLCQLIIAALARTVKKAKQSATEWPHYKDMDAYGV